MRYVEIHRHRGSIPIRWMCEALQVKPRGYYSWLERGECRRRKMDRELLPDIRRSFEESWRTYGSPRILKDLRDWGHVVGEHRVARIMREHRIRAIHRLPRRPIIRHVLMCLGAILALTSSCSSAISATLIVNKDGSGEFSLIQAALQSASH